MDYLKQLATLLNKIPVFILAGLKVKVLVFPVWSPIPDNVAVCSIEF